jgi:uncharacterized protein (TIGR00730 family)
MRQFKRLCVYCASSNSVDPHYFEAARQFGILLATLDIGLVYGGGHVGLMGAVADGALDAGGEVIGVITKQLLALEVGHQGCTKLHVVDTMHERKALMASLADGFVALPGGYGTMEELFEVVTWTQLELHDKPVGLLNIRGYYDHLLAWLDHAVGVGFVRSNHKGIIVADEDPQQLIQRLRTVTLPKLKEWLQVSSQGIKDV